MDKRWVLLYITEIRKYGHKCTPLGITLHPHSSSWGRIIICTTYMPVLHSKMYFYQSSGMKKKIPLQPEK